MAPATSDALLLFPCTARIGGWVSRRSGAAPLSRARRSTTTGTASRRRSRWPDRFGPEALMGLGEFSHVEVVFVFDRVPPEKVLTASRHPRGNPDWPEAGIFAQRGSGRPNRIGVTVCRLLAVDGRTVTVQALDAIDGTPVLDLKP